MPDYDDTNAFGIPPRPQKSQMAKNAMKPLRPRQPQQDPERQSGLASLAGMLKGKPQQYTSILKSLEVIGMPPRIMDVTLGDEPVECLVIPVQEMIYKEWQRMSEATLPESEQE